MPTAARLAAALCLALTALATAHNIVPLLPEHLGTGRFYEISMGLALLVGWFPMGKRAGRGFTSAISNGITGGVILTFWGLVVFGFLRMWKLAFRKKYDDLVETFSGFVHEIITYAAYFQDLNVLASIVIGSLVTGIVAELAARRFS
ncbi:MAG: TrgA family protein [Paracoccaceae bacterium]|nr:TrgA family protein [Paracoccaceae bacterium]MDG2257979.1 TrgA family protein [Paracoccaceae bacterium]